MAAVQAHAELGVDRTRYVDVFAALRADGLIGMAQPMPRLFGVYHSPADNGPAVLLNSTLDIVTQRHTAAHELGHHRFEHRSAYDQELDRSTGWGDGSWPQEEKVAEAFAAWFLMPRPAVLAALERIGVPRPQVPEHAYQVARWLGASYAGVVRHLVRLRLLTRDRCTSWLKVQPAALKSSLSGGAVLPSRAHVHAVGAGAHDATVHVDAGDLIVLHLPGASSVSLPDQVVPAAPPRSDSALSSPDSSEARAVRVLEVTGALTDPVALTAEVPGHGEPFRLTVVRQAPRSGVDDIWPA
jgi:Zn-dependent peptidase ImmA (M78 family)